MITTGNGKYLQNCHSWQAVFEPFMFVEDFASFFLSIIITILR